MAGWVEKKVERLFVTVTVNVWASLLAPELMPVRVMVTLPGLYFKNTFVNTFNVGGSFTGLTVRTKLVLFVAAPSLTLSVMRVVPN